MSERRGLKGNRRDERTMKYFVGIEIEADSEEEAKKIADDKLFFQEWDDLKVQSSEPAP